MVSYPTPEEVEQANHLQLCRWYRFLPSPGMNAIGTDEPEFTNVITRQRKIMDRIVERFKEGGGFTPAISKAIGWEKANA